MSSTQTVVSAIIGTMVGSLLASPAPSRPESAAPPAEASLTVLVTDVRSGKGKVHFALYNSAADFTDRPMDGVALPVKDRSAAWILRHLKPGEYAIAVFHDENNDGKFNSNFLGIPTEDYAFSNGARAGLGPPPWRKVAFSVAPGTNQHRIHMTHSR